MYFLRIFKLGVHVLSKINYGWIVVVLIVIFQGATLGFMGFCFTFWVEPWSEEFNTPVTKIMLISTFMMLVMGVFSAAIGRYIDRFPASTFVPIGLLIFASGLWIGSVAQSFAQIFIIYAIVLPFATALTGTLASQALAVKWFSGHKHMGLAIGIAAMGVSIGGIIIPPLVAEGLTQNNWRWVFRVTASIMALGLTPMMFLLLMPKPSNVTPEKAESARKNLKQAAQAIPLRQLFTNRFFIIPATAFFLDSVAFIGFQYNSASYMKSINLGVKETASFLSTLAMVMLLAKLIVGKLTDYLHYKTVFAMAACSNCIALVIFSLALTDMILIGAVFIGLGAGGLIPLQAKIISSHFAANQFGHVFGFFVFFPIAAVVGAPLLSYMRDQFGSYQPPLLIMMGFVVIALLLMLSLSVESENLQVSRKTA